MRPIMPYESPNIVIVPTMSLINKKKGVCTPSTSTSVKTTTSANVFKPTPQIAPNATNMPQDALKLTNRPQSAIKKVTKANDVTVNQGTVSKQVTQSDPVRKNSASSEDTKSSKKPRSPTNSLASNYPKKTGQSVNTKPVKVDLLSTSNDIIKQAVNNTDKKKCDQEIKINLLSRPNVIKNTSKKAAPPLMKTSTLSSGVKTEASMNMIWTSTSQIETPNQNIHYKPHMHTAWAYPPQLEIPTNQTIYCSPHMYTAGTCPPILHIPTNPSFCSGPGMGTTCTCSSLLQNSTNLSMRPYNDMTWTNPPLLETTPILSVESRPPMDTRRTCSSQIPTHLNNYAPYIDPKTCLTQYSTTITAHQSNQATSLNNPSGSLISEPETIFTKTTSQDTMSSSCKSLMDYTWLTRMHYANTINENLNKDKPANKSQNTQKCVEETHTNDLAKDLIKPTLVLSKDNVNKTDRKQYSNKESINSETNAKKPACLKKNVVLKTNKKIRETKKSNINIAIRTLETNIKKLTSNQKLYKIPKLSDSKKDYVNSEAGTNSKTQFKKMTPDRNDKNEKRTPKKRAHSPDHINKKRVRHNLENDELKHSNSSKLDQRLIRRSSGTEIKSHPKSHKAIHTGEQKETKGPIMKNKNRSEKVEQKETKGPNIKNKNRSEKVEVHTSKKIPQKKRKSHDSSCESMPKKVKEISPIKSVVTTKKSHLKHPRIQAPDSDSSDDDLGSDFDLRSKLSRDNHKPYKKRQKSHKAQIKEKAEMPRENLMITMNQNNDADQTTVLPQPGPSTTKQKRKKYKKIRLVINVIQEDTSDDSSSDASKETIPINEENLTERNLDVSSFLDDFNVDEIVNSLKHIPLLENVHQNIKRKVENTRTSAVSVSNTFVQPIIIKKEINTQHPEIQSNITYLRETMPDNVTNSESLKNIHALSSEKSLYEDIVQNIKQEKHEDQTVEAYNMVDNLNIDMAYLQNSFDVDIFETVNQLIDMVVENTEALIDKPSVVDIITDIKPEPCENYNDNVFDQDNEPQNLLITDKKNNIDNTDTQVLTGSNDSQFISSEFYHPCQSSASLDEDVFQTVNQLMDVVVKNTEALIDKPSVVELITDIKREPCVFHQDNEQHDTKIADKKNNTENAQVLTDLNNEQHKCLELYHSCKSLAIDKKCEETNQDKVKVIDEKVGAESNNNNIIIDSELVKNIILEQDEKTSETKKTEHEGKTSGDNSPAKTMITSDVTIDDNYEVNSRQVVRTIHPEQVVNMTEAIQPEIKDKISENKPATNASVTTDVTMKEDYKVKVKISSEAGNAKILVNNVNVTEILHPEVKDQFGGINTSAISDVNIEDNNAVKISKEVVKTIKLNNDENLTEAIQPEVQDKVEPRNLVTSETNLTIKDNDEEKIGSELVNKTETIKQKVQEKEPEDIPTNKASAKSDVTTEDQNNELTDNNEISNDANSATRSVKILHPSLKYNKVLAVRIEERIFDYLKLKLNVVTLIREGKFAKVFQCKDTNGRNYALKILRNEKDRTRLGFEKEKMLKELQSEIPKENLNIVYFIEGFGLDQKWCFLMDYYPVSLAQALARTLFDMDTVQDLAKQLVAAVLVMRSNNIVHSDIRPGHILLDSDYKTLKVCGFDAAYYADDNVVARPNIGTVHYRAPEIILGYSAGFSIDVWATALVMFEMVAGRKIFDSRINYNNNILFNQLSLCGQMPFDMVLNSRYSYKNFVGTAFKRITGPHGQHVLLDLNKIEQKHNMFYILLNAYHEKWSNVRDKPRAVDRAKLSKMGRLLDKMLVLDPGRRIPIEFVYGDSFFSYSSA